MSEDIHTYEYDMPTTIRSYVVALPDGTYSIILNSKLSFETRVEAYKHELRHIINGDYEKKCDVDIIEVNCHNYDKKEID